MKNFFRIIGFLFLFCLFGCLGIVDESLISRVSFKITIPESIQNENSSIARNATTENLKLVVNLETKESNEVRTEEKSVSVGQEVLISFDEIPVGNEIRIVGKLYNSENAVIYEGESAWTIIQAGKNEVELSMKKVNIEEEVIVIAEQPEIITDVNSFVFVKGSKETSTTLECSAKSIDGGVISFQWQVQNAKGEWENVEESDVANEESNSLYTSVLSISVSNFELNETKYYKCIVTNTNNEVNGTQTVSVETTATVAYVEGTLSSITAVYTGTYELLGTDINLANIIVTERWTSGEKVFDIPVLASSNRYNIAKKSNDIGDYVIGNVPYTLSYKDSSANSDATITYDLVIPVKYKLSTDAIKLISKFDGNTVAESDNGTETTLNVPQYGTVECEISPTDIGNGLSFINDDGNEGESIRPSDFGEYYSATIKKGETVVKKGAVWDDDEETTYDVIVAVMSNNDWFVCDENLPKRFAVTVYSWEISVEVSYQDSGYKTASKNSAGNYEVPVDNFYVYATPKIDGIDVSLSKEIDGIEYDQVISFSDGDDSLEITVKFGENKIGTITVVKGTVGSECFPVTDWNDLVSLISPLSNTNEDELVIYISGEIDETKITVDVDNDGNSETPAVNRPVRIKPKGMVTITRSVSYNYPLFVINENFTIEGNKDNYITITNGENVNIQYPFIKCLEGDSDITVEFYHCNFIGGINTDDDGSVLYASGQPDITLNDCTIKNCKGSAIVLQEVKNFSLNNCSFNNNETDITVKKCNDLTLSGRMTLSTLYFDNDYEGSALDISIGEGLSLTTQTTITLEKYSGETYDIDLFDLEDGQVVPDKFVLQDGTYTFDANGTVIQNTNPSITYAGNDSLTNLQTFYIYDANGLCTFRDIVNGTLTEAITIPAESSMQNATPYAITNLEGMSSISGVLLADIDLSAVENWVPIVGKSDYPFCGDFNGNGNSINNLKISNALNANQGLFGVVDCTLAERTATIQNLKVIGASINSNDVNVGCIVGYAYQVNFKNCESNGIIMTSASEVGGIVGRAEFCEFENCVNNASVKSTNENSAINTAVGGIAGYISECTAEYCYNAGEIQAISAVAGIFGYEEKSSSILIEYCINTGKVIGTSYFGGILGFIQEGFNINYCANYGKLSSQATNFFGCLIGNTSQSNSSTVTECLSVGDVETNNSYYAIVPNVVVTASYYDSDVLSECNEESSPVEGLSGKTTNELTNGTALENLTTANWSYAAGRYPIPNVQEQLSNYWDEIVIAATKTSS